MRLARRGENRVKREGDGGFGTLQDLTFIYFIFYFGEEAREEADGMDGKEARERGEKVEVINQNTIFQILAKKDLSELLSPVSGCAGARKEKKGEPTVSMTGYVRFVV